MNNRYSLHHRHPKGITLIEVMFASGIALFGLLVVVALIPLAGNELRVGLQTDRMAALGRNAVKEFDIRGMRDPSQWTWDRQGSPVLDTRGAETTGANLRWFSGNVKKVPQYRPQPQAYAIDPRFVARNGNAPFPYAPNATWTMPRISLRMKNPANPLAQSGALSQAAADHLFVARDDLVLLFDDDRSVLSKPNWGTPIRKRQYRGEISWMATVVPLNIMVGNQANRQFDDEYLLSIVVFSSRNLVRQNAQAVDAEVADVGERAVGVNLLGGGYAGGEVKLRHPIPKTVTNKLDYADNVLKLQTNSWLMLSGNRNNKAGTAKRRYVRWYRVLNVGPALVQNGQATRNVMLQGADWDLNNKETQGTIMEGVIGVFEKKIRLENSSLW